MKCLFLLVNSSCNIACTYCFYTTGYERRLSNRIGPDMVSHVAKCVSGAGFGSVILTGGDPLHVRFKHETYALIRELKRYGLKVVVNTSAAYLDDSDFDKIEDLEVDRVDISIDSHDPVIHNAQRGCHGDAVCAILGLLRRKGQAVATTTVVTAANAPALSKTVLWLYDLGVTDVRIQRAFLPSENEGASSEYVISSMKEAGLLMSSSHVRRYLCLTESAFSSRGPTADASCRMGKEYFVCDPSGRLTPCFHRADIALGNLFLDPTEDIQIALKKNVLTQQILPPCFGRHCVSLFDNPKFWRSES
jgi:MoaA/NifB/PqqE/SkfB family radical SAM enzyme